MAIRRRVLPKLKDKELKKLVKQCLHPKSRGTSKWGCLSKKGRLFKISTLSHIQIPMDIVKALEKKGKIRLNDAEYFVWVSKKT